MALSAGRQNPSLTDPTVDYANQLDATCIYQGAIVMLDSVGRAKPGATATGCIGVGVALPNKDLDRWDNGSGVTGHADGLLKPQWQEGCFAFKNSSGTPILSTTQPGTIVWIEDDQTVSVSDAGTKSVAGRLVRLNSSGGFPVIVAMSKVIGAEAANIAAQGADMMLGSIQTNSGAKTFAVSTLLVQNSGGTFATTLASAATANRTTTLPDIASDTLVSKTSTDDLTNKTLVAGIIKTGLTASGSASNDFSASTGAFATPTSASNFFTFNQAQAASATANAITDPGTAQAIPVTRSGVCAITIGSAGAETNTLAIPTFIGQTISLIADTVGTGTRAVTVASAFNQTGNTILTFAQVKDACTLTAMTVAGTRAWRITYNDGVALS